MAQATLLLIDDDPALVNLLTDFLAGQGYTIVSAHDGRAGLRLLYEKRPDLVVLDVTMPELNGWETLQRLRELTEMPVIMLTALGNEPDVLRGFSLGADDYIAKPFSFAELAARIKAVLVRSQRDVEPEGVLRGGELEANLSNRQVRLAGKLIDLTPTEFKLLVALMRRSGEVVAAEEIVREVWGPQYMDEVGYVRRYIWHLRRKIEPDPNHPRYIHNERGFGYRFQAVD